MNAIHHILGRRPVSRGNLVWEWNNREKEKVRSKSGIVRDKEKDRRVEDVSEM